jgi:hypothetical protein
LIPTSPFFCNPPPPPFYSSTPPGRSQCLPTPCPSPEAPPFVIYKASSSLLQTSSSAKRLIIIRLACPERLFIRQNRLRSLRSFVQAPLGGCSQCHSNSSPPPPPTKVDRRPRTYLYYNIAASYPELTLKILGEEIFCRIVRV